MTMENLELKKQLCPTGYLIFDIETDGLYHEATKVHCLSIWDSTSGELVAYPPEQVLAGIQRLHNSPQNLVGHNIIAFDIPVIRKLYPWFKLGALPLDTKVMCQLGVPDVFKLTYDRTRRLSAWRTQCPEKLHSSQSLRAWGHRLGILKGTTPDESWQTYSPAMLEYNKQDVEVTRVLFDHLLDRWITSASAVELEMRIGLILERQERTGVCFDTLGAERLAARLALEIGELRDELQRAFPPKDILVKRAIAKRNNKTLGRIKGEPYEVWKVQEFNPGSNQQIVERLQERYGWEPVVYTDKGNPQMDDDILQDLEETGGMPEVSLIRKFKTANKILSYVSTGKESWLNHVTPTGRIHGQVQGCGAGTRRMTHNSPNLGQVPSSRAYLGKDCRALFSAPPGYSLVGVDADQLELRTLSHFLAPFDGGEYAEAAISGSKEDQTDIHWRNARAIGVDRDPGKTIFYAYIYGAGNEKLGRTVTGSWDQKKNVRTGTVVRRNLEQGLPALVKLKELLWDTYKRRGYLLDLDGQMFRLRAEHSSLNELNQRAGAIIMKRAEVYLDETARAEGLDFLWLLHVHDEWQFAVREKDLLRFQQLVQEAFKYTTEFYKLRCPITGGSGVGNNWSETH